MKLGERIKQLVGMGRTGTEAFVEFREEQVRRAHFEYQRRRFLDDMHRYYPELFKRYTDEDMLKWWDEIEPRLNLSYKSFLAVVVL